MSNESKNVKRWFEYINWIYLLAIVVVISDFIFLILVFSLFGVEVFNTIGTFVYSIVWAVIVYFFSRNGKSPESVNPNPNPNYIIYLEKRISELNLNIKNLIDKNE